MITTTPASITVGCGDGMLYSFTSSVAARGAYPPYLYTWLVTLSGSWYEGIQSVAPGGSAASITLRQANGPGGQAYWSGPILYPYQVRVTDSRGNITTSGGIITVNGGCAYVEPPQIGFRFDNSPPALVQFSSMAPVGLAKS